MTQDEKLDIAPACAESDIWLFFGASKRRVRPRITCEDRKCPAALP
jgi:hypothetical protein